MLSERPSWEISDLARAFPNRPRLVSEIEEWWSCNDEIQAWESAILRGAFSHLLTWLGCPCSTVSSLLQLTISHSEQLSRAAVEQMWTQSGTIPGHLPLLFALQLFQLR